MFRLDVGKAWRRRRKSPWRLARVFYWLANVFGEAEAIASFRSHAGDTFDLVELRGALERAERETEPGR